MPSYKPTRSLERGLRVLRCISEHRAIGITDIARHVDLPRASVFRVVETLVSCGYVARDASPNRYRVTARTATLSSGYDRKARLLNIATPVIDRLQKNIGWPSNLAVFDHDAMTIIFTNRLRNSLSINRPIGGRSPMLATGIGRAYLAFSPAQERQDILSRLAYSQDRWDQAAGNPETVEAELARVRRRGFALADERYLAFAYDSMIWAVAVPILVEATVQACLSALILRNALTPEKGARRLFGPLQEAANEIALSLGKEIGAGP